MISKIYRFHGLGSLRPVYQRGQAVRTSEISLKYRLNERRKNFRAAVVVSKKVSKSAVKRNRIRRRIYEIIRLNQTNIGKPYEFIISVYSDQLLDWPSARLETEITKLLARAGITRK